MFKNKELVKQTVKKLIEKRKTISIMESCTGGGLANEFTNIQGISEIFEFSAVTYSNRYKKVMGVSSLIIDKYSVYSMETACDMAKNISIFSKSSYGIGITGKLNCADVNNQEGKNNVVYISIFDSNTGDFHNKFIEVLYKDREENKHQVIKETVSMLWEIVDKYK